MCWFWIKKVCNYFLLPFFPPLRRHHIRLICILEPNALPDTTVPIYDDLRLTLEKTSSLVLVKILIHTAV